MAMHGTQRRAVLATTVTMLSACGLAWAAAMPTPPQTTVPPAVQFIANPAPMTDFTAPTIAGAVLNTSDLRGKVVLVNFWATWCPPCVTEVPDLVRLQTKYEGRLVVVGVADDHGAVDVVQNFASAKHVHYPLVMNTPALAASFPGLIGLPTTYVIDQGGRIVKKHIGQLRIDRVEAEVDALLAGRVEPR